MNTKPTYQELEKELENLKNQDCFKTALEFKQNLLVEIGTNGNVTHVNPKACEVLGYSEKEIIGKNWFDNFIPDKTKLIVSPISKNLLQGEIEGNKSNENRILTKDGDERIIRWHNAIIRDNKDIITGHLSIGEDITEQKEVEEKLSQATEIIERSPSVVFLWKNENNWPVEYVSNNVKLIFGYSADEFLTNKINYNQLIHPDDVDVVSKEVKFFSENNEISFTHKPYRIITKKGKIIWVKDQTQIQRNENGEVTHYEGIILDITESIETEEDLKKLNIALNNSINEVYILDGENSKFTYINRGSIHNLGYTYEELLKISPPDISSNFTSKKFKSLIKPLTTGKVDKLQFEATHQRKNKTIYPVEVNLSKFKLHGKLHFLALIIDITERKKTAAKLIESEVNFKAFTSQSSEGISVADLKGNYTYVNPEFCNMVGYTEKELLKMTVFDITADKKDKSTFKKTKTVKEGEPVFVELVRKNGTTFIAEVIGKNLLIKDKKSILGTVRDITTRNLSEKKIKDNEFLLKETQEIAQLGSYVLNISSGLWTSSPVLNNILGIDENYKKDISGWLGIIHSKDEKEMFKYLSTNVLINHEFFDKEYRIKRISNKEVRWMHVLGKLKFNKEGTPIEMIGTIKDITDRKNAEKVLLQQQQSLKTVNSEIKTKNKKLIESEKRFKTLFDNNPVSLWEEDISEVLKLLHKKSKEVDNLKLYLDENPDFVYKCASKIKVLNVNESALKLLGIKTKEKLIANLSMSFNSNSFETLKEELLILLTKDKTFERNTEFVRSDGELIYVTLKLVIIEKTKVIISFSDITELRKAKEKAEESDLLKTEFINNMSHEIRTPMNGILGFSELLINQDVTKEKREFYVKLIKNSGHQLLQIIDDILEISRLGTKKVKVIEEHVNINDLLLELFSIFEPKAKENKTPLYVEKHLTDKQSTIITDRTKLNKILSNLLENALKFTNVGNITFGYHLKPEGDKKQLVIYVKDTGVGIAEKDQKMIFERFSQSGKEASKKVEGLGLGLSIAKENTLLLGGEITVESVKRKGTTFFVNIPYKPVFTTIETENLKNKITILIAEDEEVNYLYLHTLIKDVFNLNCNLIHAKNGQEAIDICKSNTIIDFILMDLKMPVLSGYKAATEIKKVRPTIPIIAQTAYSTKQEQQKAIAAGCTDFISKPISKDELFKLLNKFLPQNE
ncbi:MAG: PAS domain S-box protein [Lutibacter sp.]|uniref:PAS domain S-box protein n=1 Tax=Lutibacter sp. TaxID=1925666 RepID=UPI0019F379C2|nr:PAS domain S-box protein [Lutibacter sp.]NOR28007.1 PAS domain S-box protein [Lutibacter sp.]